MALFDIGLLYCNGCSIVTISLFSTITKIYYSAASNINKQKQVEHGQKKDAPAVRNDHNESCTCGMVLFSECNSEVCNDNTDTG